MTMNSSLYAQSNLGKRKSRDESDDEAKGLFVSQYETQDGNEVVASMTHNSDDDDDDDNSEPEDDTYNESMEQYPASAAYDPRHQEISERLTKLAMKAKVVLDRHDCNVEAVQRLRSDAEEVSIVPKPKRTMIGLLGEAGAG